MTHRTARVRTTWSFRLVLLAGVIIVIVLTKGFWRSQIGQSLACTEHVGPADAILIENFDTNYLLFERAETLSRAGRASRVLVLANAAADGWPSRVDSGIIDVMVRVARLDPPRIIPVRETEPISLNAARQALTVVNDEHIKSVIVVTAGFRSRRSSLVYEAVLGAAGIRVSCVPVFGETTPENWASTWHGVQEVVEQFVKLQYYRFYVLPVYT